jgi:hypothetical protein
VHASSHPVYKDHYDRTKARLSRQRGAKIARIEVARKLTEAIWHMLQNRRGPWAAFTLCTIANSSSICPTVRPWSRGRRSLTAAPFR